MKELQYIRPDKLNVRDERPATRSTLIDTVIMQPGQKIWELNTTTGKIAEAPYTKTWETFDMARGIVHKFVTVPGYMYCSALNLKNAERKFKRMVVKNLKSPSDDDMTIKE